MPFRAFVAVVVVLTAGCASIPDTTEGRWLAGRFAVLPVARPLQIQALNGLSDGRLRPIDDDQARLLSGSPQTIPGVHYYLAVAEYLGDEPIDRDFSASGIVFGIAVDHARIAHVDSFRLSRSRERVKAAVVISSELPLAGVVTSAAAAE